MNEDDHFFDEDDTAGTCPGCGNQDTKRRECDYCEEGAVNRYDEDPMWYEDKYVTCPECKGHGVLAWCPKCLLDLNSKKAERLRNPKPKEPAPIDPAQQHLNLYTMNEPIAAALHKRLTDQGQHIMSTVVPPEWHLTDTDLDRDAAFYLTKPYTI